MEAAVFRCCTSNQTRLSSHMILFTALSINYVSKMKIKSCVMSKLGWPDLDRRRVVVISGFCAKILHPNNWYNSRKNPQKKRKSGMIYKYLIEHQLSATFSWESVLFLELWKWTVELQVNDASLFQIGMDAIPPFLFLLNWHSLLKAL